jgi:predicted nucleic acid-binding protein
VSPLFADSSYYITLLLESDQMHSRAIELSQQHRVANTPLVTSAWVLLEVANILSAARLRSKFISLMDQLNTSTSARIVGPEPETFAAGIELYRHRPDKAWSLTDCISFIVMEREGVTEALTADRDFEQAGFKALMS